MVALLAGLIVVVSGLTVVDRPSGVATAAAETGETAGADAAPPSELESARVQARESGERVEVIGKRTETSTTFVEPSGLLTTEYATDPIRVRRDGEWLATDPALEARDGAWRPKAAAAELAASPGGASTAPLAQVADGDRSVSLGWAGSLPRPTIEGPVATYDLDADTALRVTATVTGARVHLILKKRPSSAPVVRLPLELSGVSIAKLPDGGFAVTDSAGNTVFDIAAPRMWGAELDEAGDATQTAPVAARLVTERGKQALELTPDASFLADATYPVTVDPDISSVSRWRDTWVYEGMTASRGGDPIAWLGSDDGTRRHRSYMQWFTPDLQGKKIVTSSLRLFNYHSGSCTAKTMKIWPVAEAWTVGILWGTQPAINWNTPYEVSKSFAHGNESLGCPNAFESITLTSMVQAWVDGALANHGIMLGATNETDSNAHKRFCSMNEDPAHTSCVNDERNPTLSVTWTTPPSAVDKRSMIPGDSARVGTVTPTLHGTFADADDGETGKIQYEVYSGASGPLVASGDGASTAIGGDSAWTVPAGKLAADSTYRWRARGVDMHGVAGPWSATKFFNTEDADLLGEQRRFTFEERDLTDRMQLKANVANGNLLLTAKDLHIRGTGIDFTLDRYYNSRSTSTSALGTGWTLGVGHDVKLLVPSDPANGDVTYVAPSGFTARFANEGTDTWRNPPGVDADLSRDTTTGEFTLKFRGTEGKYEFNSAGRLLREKDRNGNTISFGYNTAGLLSTVTDTQNRVTTLAYVSGRLSTVTDSTGRTVNYTYTSAGNVETVADAAGNVVRYRYNGDLVDQVTSSGGSITRLDYDSSRRIVNNSTAFDPGNGNPTNATTSFEYLSGETKVTDPNGNNTSTTGDGITTHHYDDRDRVTKTIDALGHEQAKSYTSRDNVATLTDTLQQQVSFGWDPNDENLTSVSLPTGAESTFDYTNTAHPHSVSNSTDTQGNTMAYTYDGPGNKDTTESNQYPGVKIEDRDYNDDGTVSKITDGDGTVTSFSYDANGNLTGVDNPAPLGDVSLTPDALSRLKTQVDGKNQTTTFTYDPIDRQDTVTYAGGSVVDRDFDGDGNLVKVTDPTGITTMVYDKLNRQTRKTLPNNEQLRYGYDHNGNLIEYDDAGGTVAYTYNQVNLLTELLEPGASVPVRFAYDDDNRRTKTTYPTSTATVMDITYDESGRQKSIKATGAGGTLSSFAYDYTKGGADTALRQSVTDTAGTTTYGYDQLNRLTSASGALSRSYEYDIDFNRTKKTAGGTTTTYGYNSANQLTTVNGTNTYNYDGNGNLTGGGGWTFSYNSKDQTTSITQPGSTALSPLTYAGEDQTERRQAGETTFATSALGVSYATDPAEASLALSTETTLSAASVGGEETKPPKGETHYYTRDNQGNLVSLRTKDATYYYLFDGLGSVVGLVDGTGTKVNSYRYDPYGEQLSATQAVANPWRYAAGHYDGQTSLTKFGTRYYNPAEARFTQPDPSGQDLDYMYASCNPTNNTDPTGTFSIGDIVNIGQAVFGCAAGIVAAELTFGVQATLFGSWLGPAGGLIAHTSLIAFGCVAGALGLKFTPSPTF